MVTQTSSQGPALPSRMSLGSVTRGKIAQPLRVLLFGGEGLGKSTFGSNAPSPIFLGAEDGTAQLDVARFPEPRTWQDIRAAIAELKTATHSFQTLVIDTIDWAEPLCWKHVCAQARKPDIEAFGYGRGYVAALDEWRNLVADLDSLRHAKRMHIVLLGHAIVRTFKNPEGDDYDRYALKVHDKAGGLLKEWCDAVLFTAYETHVLKDGNRAKGFSTGARVIHTERRAAFDAKNRFGLPEKLPLDWGDFYAAVQSAGAESDALRAEITEVLPKVPDGAKREAAKQWLANPNLTADALRVGLNRLKAMLNTKENGQ